MSMIELISRLQGLDVRLWIDEGQLCYSAPVGAMAPALRAELLERKEEISTFLREAGKATSFTPPAIVAVSREGRLPLSFAQQRLWFLAQMPGVSQAYHIPMGLHLRGELDLSALRRALDYILERHEALRTTFVVVDGEPEQRIAPPEESRFQLLEYDLRGRRDSGDELDRLMAEEARAPFDLEAGPLIRGRLIREGEEEYTLQITMHHIVSDGWSMGVFLKELSALYAAFASGEPAALPRLEAQYADYTLWQRKWMDGEVLQQQAEYWESALAGAPALLELPTDHPRPAQQDYAGAILGVALDEELTAGVKAISRRHGTTLFMTLLAGWAALLARLSGQEDVVIGGPVANRNQVEIEGLIGFFVNTLALRVDVSGAPTVGGLLERVKAQVIAAQQHQDIPFEQVVELARPVRSLSHSPVFQVMFAWQSASRETIDLPGVQVSRAPLAQHAVSKFDLTLALWEAGNKIVGWVEYATALFERATVERYFGYYRTLLQAMASDDRQEIGRLDILPEWERRQALYEWNATAVEYPREKCVHELFEEQVEKTPGEVAVVCKGRRLTYGELNERANQLARHLRGLGVEAGERVAVLLRHSAEAVISLLGALKAGCAYVPLDPFTPKARAAFILKDSRAAALLTQEDLLEGLAERPAKVVCVDGDWGEIGRQEGGELERRAGAESLAYALYTSGSTGEPKGVEVRHRALVNYVWWAKEVYLQGERLAIPFYTSLAFDLTLTSIFAPLISGGRIIVYPPEARGTPLERIVEENQVEVVKLTPSHLSLIKDHDNRGSRIKRLIVGGEALETTLARQVYESFVGVEIYNEYGPTEATVGCMIHRYDPNADRRAFVPIGRPGANTQIYVLDGRMEPVAENVVGEIYIAGDCLAEGYLNREGMTAEAFIDNPFERGRRMYRSGDLGRRLPEGVLEYVGRRDEQVKYHGHRVELGEIRSLLNRHAQIRDSVVMVKKDGHGLDVLVAYYVSRKELGAKEIREYLLANLAEETLPSVYVHLKRMPLTVNGKVDYQALPSLEEARGRIRQGGEGPRTPVEELLARIWEEMLGVERVGVDDNFFELGGHSLLAVTLVERMRRAGLQVDVRVLFARPTLAELASAVGPQTDAIEAPPNLIPPGCDAITPDMLTLVQLSAEEIERLVCGAPGGAANIQDIYPLAPLQEGILFHHLMSGEGDPYVLGILMCFDSRARLEAYLQAIQAVIDRHDIMRTAVMWEGLPEPVQVVWRKAPLVVEDVELEAGGGDLAEQLYARFNPRRYRIDVRQAPLLRVYIAHDPANQRWLLMRLQHHLTIDHSTDDVMLEEIEAHLLGKADALPAPLPFRNLVAQARLGVSREEHEAYFRQLLGDVEEPTAPFGLLSVRGDGSGIEEAWLRVEPLLGWRVRERARKLGVSAASVCHAAWAGVLARLSGGEDVVFGTVLFGRMQGGQGADRVMGLFINTLPVRMRIGGEGAEESVRRMQAQLSELLRHEHASLALAQRCSAVPAPAPLFSALFNYRHIAGVRQAPAPEKQRGREGIRWLRGEGRTNYPVTLAVNDLGEDLSLTARAEIPIEPMRICEYMHTALAWLVEALESEPGRTMRTLEVLPERERRQALYEWNATDVEYPREKCVHELFEEQVEKTPEAVALSYEGEQMSYGELNARANRLAHHLRELEVGPDMPVAICLERSLEMVIGLLAILKAGGAYVPLDPGYPLERLGYMLEDAGVGVVVTRQELEDRLPAHWGQTVYLDVEWERISEHSGRNPDRAVTRIDAGSLAYILYTSGSTGEPKGVAVSHRSLCNQMKWVCEQFSISERDSMMQKTPFTFDASVWEFTAPLLTGGRMVIARPEGHRDPAYLIEQIEEHQISLIKVVPLLFSALVEERGLSGCRSLRAVFCGGEALSEQLRMRFEEQQDALMVNLYGPTEVTIDATYWEASGDEESVAIGRPVSNTKAYVLGSGMELTPMGVGGELYLGGEQLARGYLGRAGLTAERFVPDPFGREPGGRLYRTGDRVRWRSNGNLEFLERVDGQVKLRGYRIEIGEVEATLRRQPEVAQCAVVIREDESGNRRLVAYLVVKGEVELEMKELRERMREWLPEYMAPSVLVKLEQLPLTPSGKLDQRALPAPEGEAYSHVGYEAPQGETETLLAAMWAELLRLERVGRHDNFFEIGGHSLFVLRVVNLLDQTGIRILATDLFEYPTPKLLADRIESCDNRTSSDEAIRIRKGGSESPLFLVHEGTGNILYAHALSRYLDPDMGVYGLPDQSADEPQLQTIEASAMRMVQMIRTIRPKGPYRIAGYSFGGLIAYEIAVQLIGAGEEVEFLGLLDTGHPSLNRKFDLPAFDDKKYLLIAIEQLGLGSLEPGTGEEQRLAFTELTSKSAAMEFDSLLADARRMSLLPQHWIDHTATQVRQILLRSHLFNLAKLRYFTQCIPIPVHLFFAEGRRLADSFLGWSECLPEGQIRAISTSGRHVTMMMRPHIEVLGQLLSTAIRNVSKEVNKGPVLMAT